MTPVEIKLTLDDEAGALVVVGQWALLENSCGSRTSLPSANFDIRPSKNATHALSGKEWGEDQYSWNLIASVRLGATASETLAAVLRTTGNAWRRITEYPMWCSPGR